MANKIGYPDATQGLLTDIDTSTLVGAVSTYRNIPGTRTFDDAGNEFIYLQGVASTVAGSIVSFGLSAVSAFQTALSVTGVRGPIAVAMAAVLAGQYGWYQIYGLNTVAVFNGAAVAGAMLFSASTGKCDDAVVSGDRIDNAIVAATVSGAGAGSVFLNYPSMNNGG